MSDDSFLRRWSRRKQAALQPAPAVAPPPLPVPAWTADAQIAGFRGMADYDWDFNAPDYGQLASRDDVAKLLQAVVDPPAPEPAAEPEPEAEPMLAALPPAEPEPEPAPVVPSRHGGARPA